MIVSRKLKTVLITGLTASILSGCTASLIGGAALGAADFAVDRRLAITQLDDEQIELSIKNRANTLLNQYNNSKSTTSYSVISYNHKVLLIGQAATEQERSAIEQVARSQAKVQQVYNYIQVFPSARTIGHINYDTWVTSKVRTRLLGSSGNVYPGHVKVATFNSITYVMGLLTPAQQTATTQVVSTTQGVRQVVTLYETYYPNSNNQ